MPTALEIKSLPNQWVELSWLADSGKTYHVQRSTNLVTWTDYLGPYEGEDALFVLPIPAPERNFSYRLVVSVPDGYEMNARAIVALSGQYVDLEWDNLGPAVYAAGATYVILRNGQTYATKPSTESRYRDAAVAPGKTYTYEVRFYD